MSENIRQRKRLDESNDQSWNQDNEQNGSITVDRDDDHRIRRQATIPFS